MFEAFQSQGMQMNQQVTFFSDGRDTVRDFQLYLNPQAEHLLDWFHITMRITVTTQISKGVTFPDGWLFEDMNKTLEGLKWYLCMLMFIRHCKRLRGCQNCSSWMR